jgi:hypothetical protein
VGKVVTDDQFHLLTRSVNEMLKTSGLRGQKNSGYCLNVHSGPAVRRRILTADARVQPIASRFRICGGLSGTETGISPITSIPLCHCHSNSAAYSFLHVSPTQHNICN